MDPSLRARFCLPGELPPGTWELVFEPSFQHPVGLRLVGGRVEVRTGSTLFTLDIPELIALSTRALALPVQTPPSRGMRDGMMVLVRTPTGSAELESARGIPWLELAREVLDAIAGAKQLPPKIQKRLDECVAFLVS